MKPVETGCENMPPADAELLARAAGVSDPLELVCPVRFREPLAPAVAAEHEGTHVDLELIQRSFAELARRHEVVLVEGAGGLGVPIRADYTMADLAYDLGLPLLI